jgi:hypothetical protein
LKGFGKTRKYVGPVGNIRNKNVTMPVPIRRAPMPAQINFVVLSPVFTFEQVPDYYRVKSVL